MIIERKRRWCIRWLYAAAIGHLLVGAILSWAANAEIFEGYHRYVEYAFWGQNTPLGARASQVWWISLFGATIQGLSLWMIGLISIASRYRAHQTWGWLTLGILVWAPQDMWISMQRNCWPHLWADLFALLTMLPPLAWLYFHDKTKVTT